MRYLPAGFGPPVFLCPKRAQKTRNFLAPGPGKALTNLF